MLDASIVGIGISRTDSEKCGGRDCECCCSPKVLLGETFNVVSSSDQSFIGPALRLDQNCRCMNKTSASKRLTQQNWNPIRTSKFPSDSFSINGGEEHPIADAMVNKHINGKLTECSENTCLNGGRCLPSTPGYK